MIELQRHIEILLLTNDCVIVPGLGGFMAHHIEARYDEEDKTFVPPLRTLGFNQNLTMNDSLLVQSYIECYDVSYPEALRRIEDEVSELRQHLQAEGSYELNDIGVLSLNNEGNIEFRPCEAGILTPTLYGLGTFEMKPLMEPDVAVVEEPAMESLSLAAGSLPEENEQQPTADNTSVEEEQERIIVIKMSWLRNAVAVAAAVLAFFMIGTPVSNSSLDSQRGVQQSSIIPFSAQNEHEETIEAEQPLVNTEEAATREATDGVMPEPEVTKATGSNNVQPAEEYCIVLASQVSKKNADRFLELLNDKGFKDAYVTNVKFRRVVYGHFATKDDAISQLRELRQQNKKFFGDGWVMKSDNKGKDK